MAATAPAAAAVPVAALDEKSPEDTRKAAAWTATTRSLWWWNFSCMLLHGFQAIISLIMATRVTRIKNFKLPLTTQFLDWSGGFPVQQTQTQALLPFAATTTGFAWMSAFAHLCVLIFWKRYLADLKLGMNRFRWIEYAFSSSLMMALIAMLFGVYDVLTLVLIASVNACMNLFGDLMEVHNHERRRAGDKTVNWLSFWYGCFAGIVPWAVVFAYLGSAPNLENVPGFVWGIIVSYFIVFQIFPVNMTLQYLGVWWWNDARWPDLDRGGYYFGERIYQVLSLVAKSLLLWLVIGGSNQPNAYTK